jgi:hypothetical protein
VTVTDAWWHLTLCVIVALACLGMLCAFHAGVDVGRREHKRLAHQRLAHQRRRSLSVGPQRRVVLPVREETRG